MRHSRYETPRWLKRLPLIYLLVGLAWILGSDQAVGWLYRGDPSALVYAGTLKGVLFVALTTTMLHLLVKTFRAEPDAEPGRLRAVEFRRPRLALVLITLGIAAVSYVIFAFESRGVQERAHRELRASAQRGAVEFARWHQDRERILRQAGASPMTLHHVNDWRRAPSGPEAQLLREELSILQSNHGLDAVALVTRDGAGVLAVGEQAWPAIDLQRLAAKMAESPETVARWNTRIGTDGNPDPVVDFIAPVHDPDDAGNPLVAYIVARADIHSTFEPLEEAIESRIVRIGLARRDGGQVGYLAESRPDAPFPYRLIPATHPESSFAQAVQSGAAVFAAVDERDLEVLATSQRVDGTPWFVVATVEQEAIAAQVQRLMLLIAGMSAFGGMAAAFLLVPWWSGLRAAADARVTAAEARAAEMTARLGWVTRHANDVILLLGENGAILDANDRAEQVYGYTRDELLARKVFDLRPPEPAERAVAQAQFESVTREGGLIFEATHVRRDGTRFPVEVSTRKVALGGQSYVQSIVRDISDRRRTEERLRDSEMQYRLLFRSNPHPMWVYDVETQRFLAVNDAAVERYGYSESEFLGMTIADIRPVEDRERLAADVTAHAEDLLQRAGLWRHRLKDGTLIDVDIISHRIEFDGRRARLVLANDVTRRLRAERSLRASEERYRSLFENSSDGILVVGTDRRIHSANAEYQAMLGYSLEELRGVDFCSVFEERERVRFDAIATEWRGEQPAGSGTWLHRRKDGSTFTGDVRVRALPGGELLVTVRDLTEIMTARRRIERQRDLYDLLSQCNQAIVKVGNREELLRAVARLAVERGHFLFAWVGEVSDAGDIVPITRHGDDKGYVDTLLLNVNSAGRGGHGPASRALAEGRSVIANDFLNDPSTAPCHEAARRSGVAASGAFPIFSAGRVTAALMVYAGEVEYFDQDICSTLDEMVADVSYALDALLTRRKLEDSRLLLQSLIDASDALVFATDLDGHVILANEALARAAGLPRASLIGLRRESFLPPETARAHENNDRKVIATGKHLIVEERNAEPGGERVYWSTKYPLRDVDGRIYAVAGIATDVTELRHVQQELAAANRHLEDKVAERTRQAIAARARAEAADRAKTQFLSSMSHELRSPLHSIIGFTSVLLEGLEGELTPAQLEHLRIVNDASHHLLEIINDLLDMSKIEAGAIDLEIKSMPIRRPLDRVLQRFSLQAQQKGLEMQLEEVETDLWIEGDERRIEQVVANFVSNAIKFTATGSIVVRVGRQTDRLRIDVADTGLGIAAADQSRLFKRFSQLKSANGEFVEGTGLGLAIAAGLADTMGGEIVLESQPGVGSTFSLLLPFRTAGGAS